MPSFINEIGNRYGKLRVERACPVVDPNNGEILWLAACDCGGSATVKGGHLRDGRTKSCGCLRRAAEHGRRWAAGRWNKMLGASI